MFRVKGNPCCLLSEDVNRDVPRRGIKKSYNNMELIFILSIPRKKNKRQMRVGKRFLQTVDSGRTEGERMAVFLCRTGILPIRGKNRASLAFQVNFRYNAAINRKGGMSSDTDYFRKKRYRKDQAHSGYGKQCSQRSKGKCLFC